MRKNNIAKRFIAAVNTYVALQNEKMKRYGLTELIPKVDELPDEGGDLLTRFSRHSFPALTPHRHLYFFDEFKQNADFIAFGGNDNYNDVYVVDKKTGKVLVFSEEEKFQYACADNFASFLSAFIVLIDLDVALGRQQIISNPLTVLNKAVTAAGGEKYRAFYRFIFPTGIEKILN